MSDLYAIVVGNPIDGVRLFGPTKGVDESNRVAEKLFHGDEYWVVELEETK